MLENFTFPTSFGYDLNGRGARTGWDFTQKRAHNSSLRTPLVPKTSTRKPLTSNNTKTKARNSTTCASQVEGLVDQVCLGEFSPGRGEAPRSMCVVGGRCGPHVVLVQHSEDRPGPEPISVCIHVLNYDPSLRAGSA